MANQPLTTLVIGLGGSGSWTVVHVKRQLYDAYGNDVPANVSLVALDTNNEQTVAVGGVETVREPGMGFGKVMLDSSEYAWVGGNVRNLIEDVARTDRYPHINNWLLADRYLREVQDQSLYELDKGAGMFRQFGRLALFRDVVAPSDSRVRNILENKLVGLAQRANSGTVAVMIVGSLTGGTGAGLFVDVAHLVRMVAEGSGIAVRMRGFFYLPRAFAATLPSDRLTAALPRSFGAMRELRRFLLNQDYQVGYPMYYQPPRGGLSQAWLRGRNTGSLYDFVYLVDGDGERKLNTSAIQNGVTSVVADAIVSLVDRNYGDEQTQADANTSAGSVLIRGNEGSRARVGAVGSHSYILPVQQMIESWTYQLSRDFLTTMLPAAQYDETGLIVGGLSAEANPEAAGESLHEAAQAFLGSKIGMIALDGSGRQVKPLDLWKWTWDFYERTIQKGDRATADVRQLSLENWRSILVPFSMDADPTIQQALRDTSAALNTSIFDVEEAHPTDKREAKDKDNDWRVINRSAEQFIQSQLGTISSGGGRSGGQYYDALLTFVDLQTQRFAEYLTIYIQRTLNGTLESTPNPIEAKRGKLGWLLALVRELHGIVAESVSLLEKVRMGQGATATNSAEAIERGYRNAAQEMRDKAGEGSLVGVAPYLKAQKDYLSMVDSYITHYRTEFTRDAVNIAFTNIRDYLAQTLAELEQWGEVLALESDSLYNRVRNGAMRIDGERYKVAQVLNHTVIQDPDWEQERFLTYTEERQARERIFQAWQWDTQLTQDGRGRPRFALGASVAQADSDERAAIQKDRRGNWAGKNAKALLRYARRFFRDAVINESIVKYLMREKFPDNGRALGADLMSKAGYLLKMDATNIQDVTRQDILLAFESGDPAELQFLDQVRAELTAQRGYGDGSETGSASVKRLQCDDPFRLTLLSLADQIPLDGIDAYAQAETHYLNTYYDTRQLFHIFPAEVNAVEFEQKLTALDQEPRILADKVTLLLEDKTKLLQFLNLLAYGLIKRQAVTDASGTRSNYQLRIQTQSRREGEWWLTMPSNEEPSLVDAMITYVIIGDDARSQEPGSGFTRPIHPRLDEISAYLNTVRESVLVNRVDADRLALAEPQIREWIEGFMPPLDDEGNEVLTNYYQEDEDRLFDVAEIVVQHDVLQELASYMEKQLPTLLDAMQQISTEIQGQQRHDERETRQARYDLFSVCILLLWNEMDRLKVRVKSEFDNLVGDFNM